MILLGCVGGLLPDVLRLIKERHSSEIPGYFRRPMFWLGVVLLAGIGGLATWIFDPQTPRDAVVYGYAAPELISRAASRAADQVERGVAAFGLREWWAK